MIKKALLTSLLLSITIINSSCSKSNEAPINQAKENLSKVELIKKIPQDSFGFFVLNTSSEAYKKNIASSNGVSSSKFTKNLKKVSQKTGKEFINLVNQSDSILFPSTNNKSKTDIVIGYISGNSEENLSIGAFFYSKDKDFYKNNLNKIKEDFIKSKLTIKKEGPSQIEFTTNDNKAIFLSAKNNHLAINFNKDYSNRLFSKVNKDKYFNNSTQEINRLRKELKTENEFLYAYLDVKRIIELVPILNLVPVEVKPLLNLIPQQFSTNLQMGENLTGTIVNYIPEDKLLGSLKDIFKPSKSSNIDNLSKNSIFALSLSTNIFTSLIEFSKAAHLSKKEVPEIINEIKPNSDIVIALNSFNITPFPDLQIILPVKNSESVIAFIKASIASPGTGINTSQWNVKEINGVKAQYIITPFGIGLYIANKDSNVLFATSELAMQNLLGNGELGDTISKFNSDFSNSKNIFKSYLNYPQIYKVLVSMQGMLSMFSGGQSNEFIKEIEPLKDYGINTVHSKYENNILNISTRNTKIKN